MPWMLSKNGANEVYVFITHAVLSGDAVKKIKNSKIKKLVITDTIENVKKLRIIIKSRCYLLPH